MTIDKDENFSIDNIKLYVFDNVEPKIIFDHIISEKPNHFIFFQAISPLNIHLGHSLAKRGVEISLGPDGYNVYANYKLRYPFFSIVRNTFRDNLFMVKNKLFEGKIHIFNYYKYGNNNFIDNLWITHPEQYVHQSRNKVTILKLPDFDKKCIRYIAKFFNFSAEFRIDNVIYFFNQPLWSLLADKEFEFLEEVLVNFPDDDIFVKLHPLTDPKMKLKYQKLNRLKIIDSTVPAEVILLNLKNCIVYSGWSSVLITENKTCNYYFNYPMFKKMDDPILNRIGLIVLDHIKMIESPQEMKFPNE